MAKGAQGAEGAVKSPPASTTAAATEAITRPIPLPRPVDFRALMKKVEQVVQEIERADDAASTVRTVAAQIIEKFRGELGVLGGRLYARHGSGYALIATFPDAKQVRDDLRVPLAYPPVQLVLQQGTVYMDAEDPRVDRIFETELGVREFAAVEVGDEEYILAFDIEPGHDREDILFSLGILRYSINHKLRRERMEGVFREARRIQQSILPRQIPTYGHFDLFGQSEPLDKVGGDYFDYIPVTEKILGLAIADVSGHGLPAALQVRDIYMGLRMGLGRDFKIVRTVERLNHIIYQSRLTSRFVSMFYGELELNGVFIYVNAGHPAPFHLAASGEVTFLREGGPVLGPLANATYERGFVRLAPGDLLVLYTDGIVEADGKAAGGKVEEFGAERLVEVVRSHRGQPAREVVAAIFAAVRAWGGRRKPSDDRTVVVVSYPPVQTD